MEKVRKERSGGRALVYIGNIFLDPSLVDPTK